MLVLKNLGIDLTKSETRTLLGFGFLYFLLIVIIIGSFSYLYFFLKKDLMLQEKRVYLQEISNDLTQRLKDLHINFDKYNFYPRDEKFESAIFDINKTQIFSTLNSKDIDFEKIIYKSGKYIHYVKEPESYYLGAKYIFLEVIDDELWLKEVKNEILILSTIAFFILMLIGYFLSKLFLKPMRDALHLLDRFIKDTTHELNTPISAIITNIEMIDKDKLDEKNAKKINRIEIGAKTISNIYEDLTFITLNNKILSMNDNLDLTKIVLQRVEYFKALANIKKIDFIIDVQENVKLYCDSKKITKLIDNILSNAIKYNKISGKILINLKDGFLSIEDSGKGISKEDLNNIFERYTRFDKSVGGFGIGLNIVSLIASEYGFKIKIDSKLNLGTKVEIRW